MPKAYNAIFLHKDKIEIPLFPALSPSELSATSTRPQDGANASSSHLTHYLADQYKSSNAGLDATPEVSPPSSLFEDAFGELNRTNALEDKTSRTLNAANLGQCYFETFELLVDAIESDVAATNALEANAPARLPGRDDIRDFSSLWQRWYGSRARALQKNVRVSARLSELKKLWTSAKFVRLFGIAEDLNHKLNDQSLTDVVAGSQTVKLGIDTSSSSEFTAIQGISIKPMVITESDVAINELPYIVNCSARIDDHGLSQTTLPCAQTGTLTSGQPVLAIQSQNSGDFVAWKPEDFWADRNQLADLNTAVYTASSIQGSLPLIDGFTVELQKLSRKSKRDAYIRGLALRLETLTFAAGENQSQQFDWKTNLLPKNARADMELSDIYFPWE
ncbi:MAG: hypothetical protein EOP10_32395, partial [Proteobacteria bacterium]